MDSKMQNTSTTRQTKLYQNTIKEILQPVKVVKKTPFQEQSISERMEALKQASYKRDKRVEMKNFNTERVQRIQEEISNKRCQDVIKKHQ